MPTHAALAEAGAAAVFGVSHLFEVVGPYATLDPAQVINFQVQRYRPVE
jgi:hypothetical protein